MAVFHETFITVLVLEWVCTVGHKMENTHKDEDDKQSLIHSRYIHTRDATITDFVGTIIVWWIITVITIIMHLLISQYKIT